MITQLWDIKRNRLNDNSDDLLYEMIDFRISELKRNGFNPDKIFLTISCRDEVWKYIWLSIQESDIIRMNNHESIWINLYDYSCATLEDETPLAKSEVYRLKKLLKKRYKDIKISSDLRGC